MAPHTTEDATESGGTKPPASSSPSSSSASPQEYQDHLLHRSLISTPVAVESASGSTLTLSTGQTILDACGGSAVTIIGHGNPSVLEAMAQQAQKVSYVHAHSFVAPVAAELSSHILSSQPHGLEKALFVGSGSEAVEAALKLARQYFFEKGQRERVHLIARRQGFHGSTLGAMSVSSNLARKVPYDGFAYPHVSYVSPPYAYRYQLPSETTGAQFAARLVRELEEEILRVGPGRVVAFVAETVIGATAGCVTAPEGYFAGVRAVCDRYGVLLILDEIMCGTGRTGTFFAFEQETGSVVPDMVTAAKGLAGGYAPIAALYVHRRVVDALRHGRGILNHGHTYQAHPLSCAAALAVQRVLRRDGLVARCRDLGPVLGALLREKLAACRSVGDVRGRGLFWAAEFVADRVTKTPFDAAVGFAERVARAALERGVAVYPGSGTADGLRGDHVLLAPPYNISEAELLLACEVLRDAVLSQEAVYLPAGEEAARHAAAS